LVFILLAGGVARAQVSASLDAGGTRVAYDTASSVSAFVLSPVVRLTGSSTSLYADGSISRFADGSWSVQGTALSSVFTPALAGFRGELVGTAAASDAEGATGTGGVLGQARIHWLRPGGGIWAGGGVGRMSDGLAWRTTALTELGGWLRIGPATAVVTGTPNWISDSLRFVDLESYARVVRGPVDASAFAGLRRWGRPSDAEGSTWAGITGAYWLGEHVAVVAAIGSYPADFSEGFPAGRYVSLGLRLATRRPPAPERETVRLRLPELEPVVAEFEAVTLADGSRALRIHAAGAARVEVMGDFTDWQPVALERQAGNRWSVALPVPPGVHRMNVRVDGGAWGVPPGVPVLRDEFGGAVGILVVQ
jgi:hypothetical protein